MASKIARLVQLFEQGKGVTFPLPHEGRLNIWVQKLSPFHNEECIHQGRIARSLKMMAIREVGSDEYNLFQSQVEVSSASALIEGLLTTKGDETLAKVLRDLRSDPEWQERIEVVEHAPEQLESMPSDAIEFKQMAKMLDEYQAEIVKRVNEENASYKRELQDMSEPILRERFLDQYVESQGLTAFTRVRQRYEFYYSTRECQALYDETAGKWGSHEKCDHTRLLLDGPEDIKDVPQELQTMVMATLMELTVPPELARFTAGLASSSDSPGPTKPQEDSEASSEETSATPEPTS